MPARQVQQEAGEMPRAEEQIKHGQVMTAPSLSPSPSSSMPGQLQGILHVLKLPYVNLAALMSKYHEV